MGITQDDILEMYQDPRFIKAKDDWDILTFLSDNNVDYAMDGKNIGTNFVGIAPCPNCGDSRYHFGIHTKRKYGTCFICKYNMGALKIASYYGSMTIEEAYKYFLDKSFDENMDVDDRVKQILYGQTNQEEIKKYKSKLDILPPSRLINIRDLRLNPSLRAFFTEKNLNLWHVDRYKLKIGTEKKYYNYIMWPVWYKNKLVSYQRRNYKFKRYYNPANLQNYIYGYDWIIPGQPLLLVEGFLDYTRIDTFLRAKGINNLSLTTGMLKSISHEQIQRITEAKPSCIIVMFDNDSWFDYWRVRNVFPFNVFHVILPKGHDPNMLSWSQLETIFEKEILNVLS